MDVNVIILWISALAGILTLISIVFAFFYKIRRTDETVNKIDKKFDEFSTDNVKFGLLIGQLKEQQESHERRCESEKERMDEHLDRIYRKVDELKQ